jgi:hypothetical protein
MGHAINGFIGRTTKLLQAFLSVPHAVPCSLNQGYLFLPVTASLDSGEDLASKHVELIRLSQWLEDWAIEHSNSSPIAYIETDYFGGKGEQCAISWSQGTILCGPFRSNEKTPFNQRAINRVLQSLGVFRGSSCDEFAALGLDRYRENEDWVEKGSVSRP